MNITGPRLFVLALALLLVAAALLTMNAMGGDPWHPSVVAEGNPWIIVPGTHPRLI